MPVAQEDLPRLGGRWHAAAGWLGGPGLVWIFLATVLPLCLMLARVVPPGQVADEVVHTLRADALSAGEAIGHREATGLTAPDATRAFAGVDGNLGLFRSVNPEYSDHMMTWRWRQYAESRRWSPQRRFFEIGPVAAYFPVFYLPAALALAAGHALGIAPLQCFYAARLAGALCFVMLGVAALLVARRGRALLFCVLAFPMSLSLGASLNQDGLLIATSVLGIALLTGDIISWRRRIAAAAALTLVCLAKPPYALILLALLLPLPARGAWRATRHTMLRRAGLVALCVLPVLAWTVLAQAVTGTPLMREPYAPGPLYHGAITAFRRTGPIEQLHVLLTHPALLASLPVRSFVQNNGFVRETIGVLGWLNWLIPEWLTVLWMAAFGAAVLCAMLVRAPADTGWRWPDALLLAVVMLATLEGIVLSQYLVWTSVGATQVDGVQGRYLEPLLPLLVLMLPRLRLRVATPLRAALVLVPAMAAFAGLVVLPALGVSFYYLHGAPRVATMHED